MPLLTPQLLFQIKEIIRKRHTAFIANVFGHDAVAPAVLEDLKKQGLIDKGETSVEDAYLYGQVVAHLEDPQVASMTAEQVKAHVAKNPVALTPAELAAKKAATLSAATYVVGLGNVVEKETGQLLIEADHALRAKLKADIADETAVSVAMRKTVKELKSDLGHRTQDWTRGLDRIAITEKHNAMQAGVAHGFQKQFGDPRVAIRPMPDACADCRRLHLGPDGHPRIFKLSQLAPPGANVKKPKSAWVPCLGAVHPHCQCQLVRVPAGWGFNKDSSLVPGGEFGVEHDETEKSFTRVVLEEEDHLDRLQKAHRLAGRMEYDGLLIAIEQEAGDVREWRDRNGETGTTTMLWPYGFIEGPKGADGEAIDVYVGPNPNAEKVYVVDQRKKLGEGKFGGFDEQKVMLGFSSQAEARDAYLAHYNDPGFLGAIREMDFDDFKNRVSKDTKEVVLKSAVPAVQEQFVVHADGTSFEKVFPDVLEKAGPHKYLTKVFSHGHWIYTYADEQGGKVVDHHSDPDQGALKLPKDKAHELEAFRAKHNLPGKVIVGQQYAILPVHKDAFQNTVAQPQLTIPAPATAVRKKYTSLQLADLPAGTKLRGFYGEKGFVYECPGRERSR